MDPLDPRITGFHRAEELQPDDPVPPPLWPVLVRAGLWLAVVLGVIWWML